MDMDKFKTPYINVKEYKNNPELQGELVIADVRETTVGGKVRPSVFFQNVDYAWTLNGTNTAVLSKSLGTESGLWAGAKITLKVEPTPFEGKDVDSLRIAKIVPAQ